MSYDTIKNGIGGILEGQGLMESTEILFSTASEHEFGNTYILKPLSGEMLEESGDTLADRFYDTQLWQIQVAFKRSSHSDNINLGELHRLRDTLLSTLDKPANWTSFARMLKYNNWEVEELESYFILTINMTIEHTYTH